MTHVRLCTKKTYFYLIEITILVKALFSDLSVPLKGLNVPKLEFHIPNLIVNVIYIYME